ncbi:MAG: excinuclease ABC subunit UvrA [Firmicutes bacterium]|nr:excinuclease ABC subunit UvrA [Bacillota bacterium]
MGKIDKIVIKGAKGHNLKNIDVEIPRDQLVVLTGLSGSGKSTLAFDTIYAEGQRKYVESLSAYARQFLGQMDKPDVEFIEGLSPAISIDQKTTSRNPRSTVGTVTEIYDYLRLLYARIGIPHCPVCGREISGQSVDQMVDRILQLEEGTKLMILAPVVSGKKGEHEKIIERIKKEGFSRVRIDGEVINISEEEVKLEKTKKHTIEIVVDRIVVKQGIESRLSDSIELALNNAQGLLVASVIGGEDLLFSTKFACPEHGEGIPEMEPRVFSFNAPFGACPDCNGIGYILRVDPELVVVDSSKSIAKGALGSVFSSMDESGYYYQMISALAEAYGEDLNTPYYELSEEFRHDLLYGSDKPLNYVFESRYGGTRTHVGRNFEGVIRNLERRYKETNSDFIKAKIEEYMSLIPCGTCEGKRLKPEVLAVTVGGKNIYEFTEMSVSEAMEFVQGLELTEKERIISKEILKEIKNRLNFMINVGLDYLTLSRASGTLSGGEAQRIRLATQIGSGLMGVLYILDEPSIGLHQSDNDKLIATLRNLTDIGNTLIVVEHDEDTMRAADHIIDIGPGAGAHGGEIVAQGSFEDIMACEDSITGQYLRGVKEIPVPKIRNKGNGNFLTVKGAAANNLKNVDVKIPLGLFTCITGVSGSGKSSLVNEILYKTLASKLNRAKTKPGKHDIIEGLEHVDKVINIDQAPIGRTPRSNPATYTGVFTHIRDLFAGLPEAKARGYQKGRFSFNVKGGRCEACSGDGIIKIEMHFLPDVYVPCEVCKGKRYNRETLEVKYKGKSIYDVLDMTVEEALEFFKNIPPIVKQLETLYEVGLGYIKLGQPSTQLSGGEAQRIKLASELAKKSTGKTVYILDEPTTGLHFEDVNKLIQVLDRLAKGGNTVIVIEHNLDVIKVSDHIIDLGPGGGSRGGMVVATGTPEEIAENKESITGKYLKNVLKKGRK